MMTVLTKLLASIGEQDPTSHSTYSSGFSRIDSDNVICYLTPGMYDLARKAHEQGKDHFHCKWDPEKRRMVECEPEVHYLLQCEITPQDLQELRELSSTLDHHDASSPGSERPHVLFAKKGREA